jgi:hypothetical protein
MQTFTTKFSYLLGLSVLGLATISCDTTGKDEFTEEMSALRAVSANVLIHEDFEGGTAFTQVHQQFGTSHSFRIMGDPKDRSNHAGRFELRQEDPIQSNGKRSEVLFPAQSGKDRWYSYSLYLPSNGFEIDRDNDIISQWHQSGGGSPSTTLRVRNDRFQVKSGNKKEDRKDFDLGPAEKDVWHDFVFHIVHSPGNDGLLEVWHNGVKVLEQRGGNMYDLAMPRWKIGIYKASWASRDTDTKRRILFFDNVRLGNERATLAEMTAVRNTVAEASTPTPTAPAPVGETTATSESTTVSETPTTSESTNVSDPGTTSGTSTESQGSTTVTPDRNERSRNVWKTRWTN